MLAFTGIADRLLEEFKAAEAHFCTPEQTSKVRALLFNDGGFNTAVIGKEASLIARQAGFTAGGAKVLITPVDLVQPDEKLVREKLCPVPAFARVSGIDEAVSAARSMIRRAGNGHSAAAHSSNEHNILMLAANFGSGRRRNQSRALLRGKHAGAIAKYKLVPEPMRPSLVQSGLHLGLRMDPLRQWESHFRRLLSCSQPASSCCVNHRPGDC